MSPHTLTRFLVYHQHIITHSFPNIQWLLAALILLFDEHIQFICHCGAPCPCPRGVFLFGCNHLQNGEFKWILIQQWGYTVNERSPVYTLWLQEPVSMIWSFNVDSTESLSECKHNTSFWTVNQFHFSKWFVYFFLIFFCVKMEVPHAEVYDVGMRQQLEICLTHI